MLLVSFEVCQCGRKLSKALHVNFSCLDTPSLSCLFLLCWAAVLLLCVHRERTLVYPRSSTPDHESGKHHLSIRERVQAMPSAGWGRG